MNTENDFPQREEEPELVTQVRAALVGKNYSEQRALVKNTRGIIRREIRKQIRKAKHEQWKREWEFIQRQGLMRNGRHNE